MKKSKKLTKKMKTFSRLSKDQKRVAIAKDVLEQVRLKRIIATEGSYVGLTLVQSEIGTQLQDLLPKKKCKCCGLGSCFVSLVRMENKFVVKEDYVDGQDSYIEKGDFQSRLRKYFSQMQLDLIETAFEGTPLYRNSYTGSPQWEKAVDFNHKFGESDHTPKQQEKCLVGIMENIIENKGTFKP